MLLTGNDTQWTWTSYSSHT